MTHATRLLIPFLATCLLVALSAFRNTSGLGYQLGHPRWDRTGKDVKATVQLINTGSEPLELHKFQSNCGCMGARFGSSVVPSGQSTTLFFTVDLGKLPKAATPEELTGGYRKFEIAARLFANFTGQEPEAYLQIQFPARVSMPMSVQPPRVRLGPIRLEEALTTADFEVETTEVVQEFQVVSPLAGLDVELNLQQPAERPHSRLENDHHHPSLPRKWTGVV